jgi:hypothetical protein
MCLNSDFSLATFRVQNTCSEGQTSSPLSAGTGSSGVTGRGSTDRRWTRIATRRFIRPRRRPITTRMELGQLCSSARVVAGPCGRDCLRHSDRRSTRSRASTRTSVPPTSTRTSRMGRFTSPDPYAGSGDLGNPQSWNRYSYVLNSPLIAGDPLGLHLIVPGGDWLNPVPPCYMCGGYGGGPGDG